MTRVEPTSLAQKAALSRARQLTDFKWTPIRDVPTFHRVEGQTVLKMGEEVTGFPYSSTERTDKFLYFKNKYGICTHKMTKIV